MRGDCFGTHEADEFAVPVGELLAVGLRSLGAEAVCGELSVGVVPDAGEGWHVLAGVGSASFRTASSRSRARVSGVDERLDVVEAGLAKFGRIDIVANNAGYGLIGAIEETSDKAARALFDVNVFGVLNTLRATLPTLRAQRTGHVLNIGSVGGFATAPVAGLFGASKFAVEGVSESLHGELSPLGVRVTIVEPGGFRTDFLSSSSMHVEPASIADYAAGAGPVRKALAKNDGRQPGDPVKAAKAIVDITEPPLGMSG